MKKCRIGDKTAVIVVFLLCIILCGCFILAFLEYVELTLTMIILFLIFLGFLIYLIVFNIKSDSRVQYALEGHKSTGVVADKYRTRNGPLVKIQFKTDEGEDALLVIDVKNDVYKCIELGDEIPLYVNGDCACFIDDEILEKGEKK